MKFFQKIGITLSILRIYTEPLYESNTRNKGASTVELQWEQD